ncbi:MAG TPA: monofunctional biosynthetic peptidoglycan transglycosylase [Rhizomicrobium sp.]|nr:monofunctional biosynthetic peptidoglycan transglycosylase [Rhizomicrobium sp.]
MASTARSRKKRGRVARWFSIILGITVVMPVVLLLAFRFAPVPGTPQMAVGILSGEGAHYSWRDFDEIAPSLPSAVIAAEDQRFCSHNGFDWVSIDKAVKDHEKRGRRLRGASTISQQTARSMFLVPVRSWIRKGIEAYLTVLMEALWPKKRILTAYLNLVDWGHGNYGAEAASQAYFHISATHLSPTQSARLAAILPDPDDWNAARPGPYVARRSAILRGRLSVVHRDALDVCVKH